MQGVQAMKNRDGQSDTTPCEGCEHPDVCRQEDECLIDHHALSRREVKRKLTGGWPITDRWNGEYVNG